MMKEQTNMPASLATIDLTDEELESMHGGHRHACYSDYGCGDYYRGCRENVSFGYEESYSFRESFRESFRYSRGW